MPSRSRQRARGRAGHWPDPRASGFYACQGGGEAACGICVLDLTYETITLFFYVPTPTLLLSHLSYTYDDYDCVSSVSRQRAAQHWNTSTTSAYHQGVASSADCRVMI